MTFPRCIASTNNVIDAERDNSDGLQSSSNPYRNFYKEACWSPDGQCVITSSADNCIRTYIVPSDLLEEGKQPHHLEPYSTMECSESVKAYDCYPGYTLLDPRSTLVLSSQRDHPISLDNLLDRNRIASYPLINPTTEAFISPHSLLFSRGGSQFITGSENLVSVFDVSRAGQGPVSYLPTSSRKGQDGVMGMKGIVSALTVDETTDILAAGTFSRHVGLYDSGGQGECVGVFCIEGTDADKQIGGAGITQVAWSDSGRYLYIAERKSNGVMFYDIRKTGQLLGWLVGRKAITNQRLGVDVVSGQHSTIVWAGGVDGHIRQWCNPHELEGPVETSAEWTGHSDVVSSAVSHGSASVLASCSGQRHVENAAVDNTLKIWTLP